MKNRYQSWLDYIHGRMRCPKCKRVMEGSSILHDFTIITTVKGKTVQAIVCTCGFKEVVKRIKEKVNRE